MKSIFTALLLISLLPTIAQVTFTDVAPTMGVDDPGNGQGVSSIDFNNDGYIDIFLVNNGQACRLYQNDLGIFFTDVALTFGVNNTGNGRGNAIGDYNNDGLTDIVIGNFNQSGILFRNDSTTFTNVTSSAGMNLTTWGGSINWFDYYNDSRLDCFIGNDGVPSHLNYLFRNEDLSTFTNVAASVGLTENISTLSVATADYDNDGDLDIFIGNQTGSPTGVLYRNDGSSFTDVTVASGLVTSFFTWGADWGDLDNDGDLDLYLANSNAANQCFVNNGDSTFTESAAALGIDDATQSFSCGWADFDNDGDLDLYVANASSGVDKLYRNDGATFTDVAATVGTNDLRHSNSTTWADFNNDGFLDLYLSNNGSANRLYMSDAGNPNHWLELKLVGVTVNRSAIGARIRIVVGGLSQIREVQGGSGHNGQNSLPVEFGLGSNEMVDSIIVNWPGGPVDIHTNIPADQILTVVEGEIIVAVELTSFTATTEESNVLLSWQTATETNNQGFEIQRSNDGNFISIGFVDGHGTTTEIQSYTFTDEKVLPGNYSYRLKQVDYDGTIEYSDIVEVEVLQPLEYSLSQNYPNPFNPNTTIEYSVPERTDVKLMVVNLVGEEVKVLVSQTMDAGNYKVEFNASNLPSGVYFYRLLAGDFMTSKKMILLK